jgi:hypothetical protein
MNKFDRGHQSNMSPVPFAVEEYKFGLLLTRFYWSIFYSPIAVYRRNLIHFIQC